MGRGTSFPPLGPSPGPPRNLSMSRIQQLPSAVVTRIAAGEVIDRPSSVVKELLENAVDAGSSRIDIEVEQGGMELICVVDNGCGIFPNDLPLAFANHATSKLGSTEDLATLAPSGSGGKPWPRSAASPR